MSVENLSFGTDGIRGRVGDFPIDCNTILKLGWALGTFIRNKYGTCRIVVGKDTRISGYLIESLFEAGLIAAGAHVFLLGPLPSPGIAHLIRAFRGHAGVVISASHNVYSDNGVKFFNQGGFKFNSADQKAILDLCRKDLVMVPSERLGRAERVDAAIDRYVEYCKGKFDLDFELDNLKIVIDCANGAGYKVGPSVFRELGADVIAINVRPDGTNINAQCGSLYPEFLRDRVLAHHADLGFALDGDGDRLTIVTKKGRILNGDDILYLLAKYCTSPGMGVVGTIMSNNALEKSFSEIGIPFAKTSVGDHHVVDALVKNGWMIGAEPSGHVLQLDKNTCSDGILSALSVISIMYRLDKDLDELMKGFNKMPSRLVNLECSTVDLNQFEKDFEDLRNHLGPFGKLLVRKSGTEAVVRVLVESESMSDVERVSRTVTEMINPNAYAT